MKVRTNGRELIVKIGPRWSCVLEKERLGAINIYVRTKQLHAARTIVDGQSGPGQAWLYSNGLVICGEGEKV